MFQPSLNHRKQKNRSGTIPHEEACTGSHRCFYQEPSPEIIDNLHRRGKAKRRAAANAEDATTIWPRSSIPVCRNSPRLASSAQPMIASTASLPCATVPTRSLRVMTREIFPSCSSLQLHHFHTTLMPCMADTCSTHFALPDLLESAEKHGSNRVNIHDLSII